MKKTLAILLLCLGFCIGASAQDTKANHYAEQMAIAVNDMLHSRISLEEYVKICEKIGVDMGVHMADIGQDQTEDFLEDFFNCIYYNCAKYDIPKEQADMIISSFKQAFYGTPGEIENYSTESIAATAEQYAKDIAVIMGEAMEGKENKDRAEKLGYNMGVLLSQITPDEVKLFQEELYKALAVHISRLPAFSEFTRTEINILVDMIKEQYDPIFKAFY